MQEIKRNARELMKNFCRVCPICNGVACAGEVPGMGGAGTGLAFRKNLEALNKLSLNMRLIHNISQPDLTTTILEKKLSIPVIAAPIGGVSFNMGGKITEDDYISAIIEGCQAEGTIGTTGDGAPEFITKSGFAAIKKSDGHGIPFLKPWADEELFYKLDKAAKTGADIFGMDIDAVGLVTIKLMGHQISPKPLEKLKEIKQKVPGKFILKGIMTVKDALLAVESGADAIVVSNHGGRVLDNTPGTTEVLPKIADAVKGKTTILIDGGIRYGIDILKVLALGADGVMIGRPFSIAAVGGLKEGVIKYIQQLKTELKMAMILTGCESISDITEKIINN